MAAIPAEIDSFYLKFSQLFNCGINARLTLNCRNGKLCISLNADLDPTQQYNYGDLSSSDVPNSARARRRQRRCESQKLFKSKQSDQDHNSQTCEGIPRDELGQVEQVVSHQPKDSEPVPFSNYISSDVLNSTTDDEAMSNDADDPTQITTTAFPDETN